MTRWNAEGARGSAAAAGEDGLAKPNSRAIPLRNSTVETYLERIAESSWVIHLKSGRTVRLGNVCLRILLRALSIYRLRRHIATLSWRIRSMSGTRFGERETLCEAS